MDADTPQKQNTVHGNFSPNYDNKNVSILYDGHKPGFHPRTPSSSSASSASILSFMSASILSPPAKRFHLQTTQSHNKRQQQIATELTAATKIRNPFEAALAERLHLPIIGSPSLFQRPTTPQLSSTQFEWTIEDVSSLKPVHVEPHETQFHDSPDPDYEAKAQSAISSFFKEQQIVPSPVNCPLRQKRIILAEINGNTPIAKPGRRIRDFGTQTALTLPPKLPADLEEALRPYFQPQLAIASGEESRESPCSFLSFTSSSGGGGSGAGGHNVSMRRKLFDMHNIIVLDENRKLKTPTTPQLSSPHSTTQLQGFCSAIVGKLSDSLDKSSVSLMSPISGNEYFSPQNEQHQVAFNDNTERNNRPPRRSFLFKSPNSAELSPIFPSPRIAKILKNKRKEQTKEESNLKDFETPAKLSNRLTLTRRRLGTMITDDVDGDGDDNDNEVVNIEIVNEKFTPNRSSSPLHSFHSSAGSATATSDHATTFATESFHQRISRLVVTSAGKTENSTTKLGHLDTTEIIYDGGITLDVGDVDVMQISQLNSNLSSSSINSHCDTPTGKRRSANRKNLSQSFTTNLETSSSEDEGMLQSQPQQQQQRKIKNEIEFKNRTKHSNEENSNKFLNTNEQFMQKPSLNFYRTDSGFNELTTSSTSTTALLLLSQQDESSSREVFTTKSQIDFNDKLQQQKMPLSNVSEVLDVSMNGCCSTPSKNMLKDF